MIIERLRQLKEDGTFELLRRAGKKVVANQMEEMLTIYNCYDSLMKCGQSKHNAVYLTARKLKVSQRKVYYTLKQIEEPNKLFNDEKNQQSPPHDDAT